MASKINPWLGLASYTESHRLYGRDAEIVRLLDIVVANPEITVIYGKSGVGKTSILRAGIFPRVRTMGFFPVYLRLDHDESCADDYTRQVVNAVSREVEKCHLTTVDLLESDEGATTLWEFFHRYKYRTLAGDDCCPIVFFDQFEELFTISGGNRARVDMFLHDFSLLLNDVAPNDTELSLPLGGDGGGITTELSIDLDLESSNGYSSSRLCRLAISIREDQLFHVEKISSTIPCLKRNRYFLQGLSYDGAIEVAMKPAPDIVTEEVARDVVGRCRNGEDEFIDPAFLSLVMYKLYEKMGDSGASVITSALVSESVANIFSDYYTDAISGISEHSVDFLEDKLVSKAGFRLSVPLSDIKEEGVSDQEVARLKNSRVVTLITRGNHVFVELTHDLLCPEVAKNKAEREKRKLARRNLRRTMLLVLVSLLVFGIAAVFAYLYVRNLESQRELAAAYSEMSDKNQMLEQQKQDLLSANHRIRQGQDSLALVLSQLNESYDELAASRDNLVRANWQSGDNSARWVASKAIEKIENGDAASVLETLLSVAPTNFQNPDKPFNDDLEYALRMAYNNQSRMIREKVTSVSFSPDGKRLVTSGNRVALWDVRSGKKIKESSLEARVSLDDERNVAKFSPDGKWIASITYFGNIIKILDANSLEELCELREVSTLSNVKHRNTIHYIDQLAISPDSRYMATASIETVNTGTAYESSAVILIWDVKTQQVEKKINTPQKNITSVAFSPDGKRLLYGARIGTVNYLYVHDLATDKVLFQSQSGGIGLIAYSTFSPDGKFFAYIENNNVVLFNGRNFKKITQFQIAAPTNIIFTKDSGRLLVEAANKVVYVYDLNTYERIDIVKISDEKSEMIALGPDGKHIAVVYKDVFQLRHIRHGFAHDGKVDLKRVRLETVVSPDGKYIAAVRPDSTFALWNVKGGKKIWTMTLGRATSDSKVVFSPDSRYVVTTYDRGVVGMWNIATGKFVRKFHGDRPLSFMPDGRRLCVDAGETGVFVYDVSTGSQHKINEICSLVCVSADGRKMAFASDEGITVRDAATYAVLINISNQSKKARMALSPDGERLAVLFEGNRMGVFDTMSGELVNSVESDIRMASSLAFSPDGKYLAVGGEALVAVYSAQTLQKVQAMQGEAPVVFSSDGRSLMFVNNETMVAEPFIPIQEVVDELRRNH